MTKRKRFYVGLGKHARVVFASAETPTENSHGGAYGAAIGPFRTKAGAMYMAAHGAGNPHCLCVADAERLAKVHQGQSELGAAYGKHLDAEIWRKRDAEIQAERDKVTIRPQG